ncbi:hypothetical protein [Oceanithermus sp.]
MTFPELVFNALFVLLAFWGAWLGWTRSKSPTVRVFVTVASLAWAAFLLTGYSGSWRVEVETTGGYGIPVTGDSSVCTLCYQGPAGRVYVVAGARIENGTYHVTSEKPVHYSVRFNDGGVYLNDKPLQAGCHEGEAQPYDAFVIRRASGFRLEVGEAASCR